MNVTGMSKGQPTEMTVKNDSQGSKDRVNSNQSLPNLLGKDRSHQSNLTAKEKTITAGSLKDEKD